MAFCSIVHLRLPYEYSCDKSYRSWIISFIAINRRRRKRLRLLYSLWLTSLWPVWIRFHLFDFCMVEQFVKNIVLTYIFKIKTFRSIPIQFQSTYHLPLKYLCLDILLESLIDVGSVYLDHNPCKYDRKLYKLQLDNNIVSVRNKYDRSKA